MNTLLNPSVRNVAVLGLTCFMLGCYLPEPPPSSQPLNIGGQTNGSAGPNLPAGLLAAYAFNCVSGPTIITRIAGGDAIDLVLPDEIRRLRRELTAFGVKYSNYDVSLWNKGREVTLQIRGHSYLCVEERAESIREDALLRGVQFRASGEEGDWVLEVSKERISFTDSIYGSAVVPRSAPEETEGTTIYVSTTEAHRLQVIIDQRECVNFMTGERSEASVEVNLDGDGYRGCGYAP